LKKSASIGIFDSGIGGLTVAGAITRALPNENTIYFGDTAHMPYGDKSPELIKRYSTQIADFLLSKGCKAIVIACNTASAQAYKEVVEHVNGQVPVINVIDPVAQYITTKYPDKKIGVIGTKGTIGSGIYPKKIKKLNKNANVTSLATPLLAPMIEEGFFNNNISRTIINSYLSKKNIVDADVVILACTHYPLIKKDIIQFYGKRADVVDSSDVVAAFVENVLRKNELINTSKNLGKHEFYVSDFTESFEKSTKAFFGEKIDLKEVFLGN
jgi:glutamate racemase